MRNFEELNLDPGISLVVKILMENGIKTFESCQGGHGHAYNVPTVCFEGDQTEGYKVFAMLAQLNFVVINLKRSWPIQNNEIGAPYWQLELAEKGQPISVV